MSTPGPSTTSMIILVPEPSSGAWGAELTSWSVLDRPPLAHRAWLEDYGSPSGGRYGEEWNLVPLDETPNDSTGLVIWWEGKIARAGFARAAWLLWRMYSVPPPFCLPSYEAVLSFARTAARLGLCSVVTR